MHPTHSFSPRPPPPPMFIRPAPPLPPPPPPPPLGFVPFEPQEINSFNQVQHNIQNIPIAPALFSSHSTPLVDLDSVSVGTLANVAKTAKRLGHPAYAPIDINIIAQVGNPYVEPARTEARLNEFYKRLHQLVHPEDELPKVTTHQKRERSAIETALERYGSGVIEQEEEVTVKSSGYAASNKQARYQTLLMEHQQQMSTPEISASNIGHSILSNLGWESGQGLGSKGDGVQVPIAAVVKKDKTGLGATTASTAAGEYRSLMSSEYKMKMQDRESSKK